MVAGDGGEGKFSSPTVDDDFQLLEYFKAKVAIMVCPFGSEDGEGVGELGLGGVLDLEQERSCFPEELDEAISGSN